MFFKALFLIKIKFKMDSMIDKIDSKKFITKKIFIHF